MVIQSAAVPFFPEAKGLAEMGMIPGGLHRNQEFRKDMVEMGQDIPDYLVNILFDPQTSGGLLISTSADRASTLIARLHEEGIGEACIIGEIISEPKVKITIT